MAMSERWRDASARIGILLMAAVVAGGGLARAAAAAAEGSSALAANGAVLLPDAKNPDYVYCNDFESMRDSGELARRFDIRGTSGLREGAGYRSKSGYATLIAENKSLPSYPQERFPPQTGVFFVHFNMKTPRTFYLGRATHAYYIKSSKGGGSVVLDGATDHPAWLNPEWDPHTALTVYDARGYKGPIVDPFEGMEPKLRGEWHSYQIMVIPSNKDPNVGYQKVWVDGELAVSFKAATRQDYDLFWLSNYWHSLEYSTKKGNLHRVFEEHTAPPHPAFEIQFDNLIVSKSFIEFDRNKPQIERIRFSDLQGDALRVHFHTTVPAARIAASWKADGEAAAASSEAAVGEGDAKVAYFHVLPVNGLKPNTRYELTLTAVDRRGRTLTAAAPAFTTAGGAFPSFEMPGWRCEVYAGHGFRGTPAMVRNFASLSYNGWTGHDTDEIVDTRKDMCVRFTRKASFAAGAYAFRVTAYDGVTVKVDGQVKVEAVAQTEGARRRRDFAMTLAEGMHDIVVEHTIWRGEGWDSKLRKYLCFMIEPEDKTPPRLLAHAVYDTRFHNTGEPRYCGRWTEHVNVDVDFGETPAYGRSAKGAGRYPYVNLGKLEIGKTYHWRVTAVDLMGNTTVTPDATFVCGDTIPPGKILARIIDITDTSATLTFRAPGEDGGYGVASAYDVRWSADPITILNWDQATRCAAPAPQKAGTLEKLVVGNLPAGKTWYIAIQATDQSGLRSLLSNVVCNRPGPEAMDLDGDGYGVACPLGDDPDDYDPKVPGPKAPG